MDLVRYRARMMALADQWPDRQILLNGSLHASPRYHRCLILIEMNPNARINNPMKLDKNLLRRKCLTKKCNRHIETAQIKNRMEHRLEGQSGNSHGKIHQKPSSLESQTHGPNIVNMREIRKRECIWIIEERRDSEWCVRQECSLDLMDVSTAIAIQTNPPRHPCLRGWFTVSWWRPGPV